MKLTKIAVGVAVACMPSVAFADPATLAVMVGSWGAETLAVQGAFGAFFAKGFGLAIARGLGAMVFSSLFTPKQQKTTQERGVTVNSQNPVAPIPVVYGTALVGGNRCFVHEQGSKNEDLYITLSLCEGEIEGFETDVDSDLYVDSQLLAEKYNAERVVVDFATPSGTTNFASYGYRLQGAGVGTYQIGNGSSTKTVTDFYGAIIADSAYASDVFTVSQDGNTLTFLAKDTSTALDITVENYTNHSLADGALWTTVTGYDYSTKTLQHIQSETRAKSSYNEDDNYIALHTGSDAQAADSTLVADVSQWTSNHRLLGTAYLALKFKYDEKIFTSFPTVNARIKGRKVYDTRTSATIWSDNPAVCIRDYLTNTRYGVGIDTNLIDDDYIDTAANYCDEMVCSLGTSYGTQSACETANGVWEKRYTLNGVVDINQLPMDNVREMLSSCRGMLGFYGGKWKLSIDKDEVSSFTFDSSNIVGSWNIDLGGKSTMVNRIRAEFANKDKLYTADFALANSTAYRTADNETLLEQSMLLPFTTKYSEAQRITVIDLHQSRQAITCAFVATIKGLMCEVGDIVKLTHDTPGWVDKKFRITRMEIMPNDEVQVSVREHDPAVYDYGTLAVQDTIPDTNLPDPSEGPAAVTELRFIPDRYRVFGSGILSWEGSNSPYIDGYRVTQTAEDGAVTHYDTADTTLMVYNMEYGLAYTFKITPYSTSRKEGAAKSISRVVLDNPIVPRVTGQELVVGGEHQANRLQFTGKNVTLAWRHSDPTDPVIEALGANARGGKPEYLRGYQVEVFDSSDILMSEHMVEDNTFIYTLEQNRDDYLQVNSTAGANREMYFKIRAVNNSGQRSSVPAMVGGI